MAATIYTRKEGNDVAIPSLDLLTLLFDSEHCLAEEDTPLHAEAKHPEYAITKARARELTKQFAYFFRNQYGIGKSGPGKDVVLAVSLGQCALPCVFYGVVAADGIYSSASPSSTLSDLARQLKDGPAKVLVCGPELHKLALAAAKEAGLPPQNVVILESYPQISLQTADGKVKCDFQNSLDWRRITDPKELEYSKISILYSSGTTGLPKGVLISHTNIVSEAFLPATLLRPIQEQWKREGRQDRNRTLGHLPTAHIAGLQGYFINPFFGGGIVYWMPSFDFDDFIKYCSELQITDFFTVPPIYMAIAKHPAVKDQLRFMNRAVTGAAPLSRELQEAATAKMQGATISQTWGLSETTGSCTYSPPGGKIIMGSMGPLLPNILLRLVDDNDQDVQPGEPGEALVKAPTVTKGYHNNPTANKNSFTSDGWFRTGDILRVEDGELYMVDRKKELIKYKGLQVAPAELEGILSSHPAVLDAAVIGIQREDTEVPRAFVVLAPPAKGKVSENDLVEYVKGRVAGHKQLRGGVKFVDAVPRNPSGKILRKELRQSATKDSHPSKL